MDVNAMWIPKSEKGRQVARMLKDRGYRVRNADVVGRFVCNLGLDLTCEDLRQIAYILDAESASHAEGEAIALAQSITDNPLAYGIPPERAEVEAERVLGAVGFAHAIGQVKQRMLVDGAVHLIGEHLFPLDLALWHWRPTSVRGYRCGSGNFAGRRGGPSRSC